MNASYRNNQSKQSCSASAPCANAAFCCASSNSMIAVLMGAILMASIIICAMIGIISLALLLLALLALVLRRTEAHTKPKMQVYA